MRMNITVRERERERNKKMTDPEGGGEVAKMHLGRYV